MPIPRVKKYETNKEYIQRCMGNAAMTKDHPNRDERYAICQTNWKKNFDPKQ